MFASVRAFLAEPWGPGRRACGRPGPRRVPAALDAGRCRPEFLARSRSEAAQIAVDAGQATEAPGGDLERVVEDGEGA
jgi:hypothetical protein